MQQNLRSTSGPRVHLNELEALALAAMNTKQDMAAHTLKISTRTYRRLLQQVTRKLHAHGTTHAACLAIAQGLLIRTPSGTFRPNPFPTKRT